MFWKVHAPALNSVWITLLSNFLLGWLQMVLLDGRIIETNRNTNICCITWLCSCLWSYQPPCVTQRRCEFCSSLELELVGQVYNSLVVLVYGLRTPGPTPGEAEIPIYRKEQKMKWYCRSCQWKNKRIKAPVYVNRHLGSGIYFVHRFVPGLMNLICPTAHQCLQLLTKHCKLCVIF